MCEHIQHEQIFILNKLKDLCELLNKFENQINSYNENKKKKLGQYYTTNYEYILKNMYIPDDITSVIEPFAGQCDLIKFLEKYQINKHINIECYDIDVKNQIVLHRDTLNNPPIYTDKFILTNPPYLARNKSNQKKIFNKYNQNDLYKCFISELTINKCIGGIIIAPLNFWCSIRKNDILLREKFIQIYDLMLINIFEEQVFNDTTYAICSFQFKLRNVPDVSQNIIKCDIYKGGQFQNCFKFTLSKKNNFTFGGEIYNLKQSEKIIVGRITKNNNNSDFKTNILLKCIDDSLINKINISVVDEKDIYIDNTPKLSARSYATLVIKPKLNNSQVEMLVGKFNTYLNDQRKKYNSLFLTNYRESNTIARKRISFSLAFNIINHILHSQILKDI